jgi:hypothetical protein
MWILILHTNYIINDAIVSTLTPNSEVCVCVRMWAEDIIIQGSLLNLCAYVWTFHIEHDCATTLNLFQQIII